MYSEPLPGVLLKNLVKHTDRRGWLIETYRKDELPDGFHPVMGYFSVTKAGVVRGPHEHKEQTDGFVFVSGTFQLHLWENRAGYESRTIVIDVGEKNPVFVIVPPGVVHAYKNVGPDDAFVLNFPNKLYGGWGRNEIVDEIRYEDDINSPFRFD